MKYFHPKKYWRLIKEWSYNFFWYYIVPDSWYLKYRYKQVFGKPLNLKNPQTFNEKIQWLKLYDRNPLYTKLVDKVAVKDWVKNRIGEEYIIPNLAVWNNVSQINWDMLPNQFVIKCNHDAASYVICTNKTKLDITSAAMKLRNCLKTDYYRYENKQWAYKGIKRKILAEAFIKDSNDISIGLTDYKFFCFNGVVDCVMVSVDRHVGTPKFYFYDREWNILRYNYRSIQLDEKFSLKKPTNFDKMWEIAEILSADIPFVRVDLYNCSGKIFFGEMTFYPDGGADANLLAETELRFGNKLILPNKKRK